MSLHDIKTPQEMSEICDLLKQSKQKIVFTNGCFDIIHPGHIRYLSEAQTLGDYLIVAINSDHSVRKIKGEHRPINTDQMRAVVVAALEYVDFVVIFNEETPLKVIETLQPHVLVKGGDWKEDQVVGADIVKNCGGLIKIIPFVEGFSTTHIIEKIKGTHSESI